jgi:putative FmdB family regulatory protein
MPTYEYMCESCKHEWEDYHSIMQEPVKVCPECGKETAKRLISGGSGRGVVTLYGQEREVKIKSDAKKWKKEIYANEYQYANVIGESKYQDIQARMDNKKAERKEKIKENKKISRVKS